MTVDQTRAWILLSMPETPETLPRILGSADGLNKAIPTHDELCDALGWLCAAGLIESDGARYATTVDGRQLVNKCGHGCQDTYQLWDKLAEALGGRHVLEFEPASLSEEDVHAAYQQYRQEFWRHYKKLNAEAE